MKRSLAMLLCLLMLCVSAQAANAMTLGNERVGFLKGDDGWQDYADESVDDAVRASAEELTDDKQYIHPALGGVILTMTVVRNVKTYGIDASEQALLMANEDYERVSGVMGEIDYKYSRLEDTVPHAECYALAIKSKMTDAPQMFFYVFPGNGAGYRYRFENMADPACGDVIWDLVESFSLYESK